MSVLISILLSIIANLKQDTKSIVLNLDRAGFNTYFNPINNTTRFVTEKEKNIKTSHI